MILTAVHEAQGRIWYTGTKSLVRPLQVYHVARGCQGTASEREDWLWSAQVDTTSEQMTLQWGFTTSDEKGQSVCIRGGHRSEMPLYPSLFGGQSDEPLVMSLDSAATKETTAKEEHGSGQEWLKVKVVGGPLGAIASRTFPSPSFVFRAVVPSGAGSLARARPYLLRLPQVTMLVAGQDRQTGVHIVANPRVEGRCDPELT